ncbi:MAG: heme ABC transporter ATP-binding protein [Desulfobacterales bacterium]
MTAAIETDNLSHAFADRPILLQVSLAVGAGDFFVVIGPNGSGKTTLMKLMCGILKPGPGRVRVFGRDLRSYSHRSLARTIAYVPQVLEVNFPFTVEEAVLLGRAPHQSILGVPTAEDVEAARRAMAFTGVEALAGRTLEQLSGGEQQRVSIARALCQEPAILLLDEPTASLDLSHQLRLMDLMESLRRERAVTVVMVSHDLNLAAMYADRLLLLTNGEIARQGAPAEVLTVQNLEAAYGCRLKVDESPFGNLPRVTLVPEKFGD